MPLKALLKDERASAYAWLLFFVFMWVFSIIWFFFLSPMWNFTLRTAEINNYVNEPGAMPLYLFFASYYQVVPILFLIFLTIGLLKYASTIKRDWR